VSFGLTIEKLFLIGLVALLIVGPDRLPAYSAQLARLVKRLKSMAQGAETRLREEMGDDFDPAEWRKLDPRKYDPRRIIRDALVDEASPVATVTVPLATAKPSAARVSGLTPFDSEST
jgi:sec-independent protein translocase protein TatB